jgi:hypothetical protein
VKTLDRPKLRLAANKDYTDDELESLHEVLSQAFEVKTLRYEEFQADGIGPIILFIFTGIASGFFQSIGKTLWNAIKERIAFLVAEKSKGGTSDLEFSVEHTKGTVRFRICNRDAKIIEKAIDQFPEALEFAEKQGYKQDYYEFDSESEEWTR